uniref:Imm-5-like domain-containing protein n=1 Tax=viral metagenome TaxID=1070528 RepID=A0A6M3J9E8_9ZZZZ
MPTYYKVLGPKGEAIHGGSGRWHLPKGKRPGKWMRRIPNPVPCICGYHVVTAPQLLTWLDRNDATVYRVDVRGTVVKADDKSVAEQARLLGSALIWNPAVARLFAADCAEHVLPIFEKERPHDDRPRKAIAAARAFARDQIDAAAWAAAGAAARAAAGAAARDAARDAERRWQTRRLLAYLAGRVS